MKTNIVSLSGISIRSFAALFLALSSVIAAASDESYSRKDGDVIIYHDTHGNTVEMKGELVCGQVVTGTVDQRRAFFGG